jgi:hypothetical protein
MGLPRRNGTCETRLDSSSLTQECRRKTTSILLPRELLLVCVAANASIAHLLIDFSMEGSEVPGSPTGDPLTPTPSAANHIGPIVGGKQVA